MSMNLANLLNDGKLKKTFMVATLASTVLGSLTACLTLHDKVQDKRFQAKQKQLDEGQDEKIQQNADLIRQIQDRENNNNNNNNSKSTTKSTRSTRSRSTSRSRRPKPRRRSTGDDGGSDDFDRQVKRSRAMIAQEFDQGLAQYGEGYAKGDAITENRLQAQVIALQQSVIDVLQDAAMSGRPLSKADVRRLVAAQDRARDGSLDALRDQSQRMSGNVGRRGSQFENQYSGPPMRQLTLPSMANGDGGDESFAPVRRVQTLQANNGSSFSERGLYCRYAYDLQRNSRKGLNPVFAPSGSQRCPACDFRLPFNAEKAWVIESEEGTFTVDSRLVIKSHTSDGDYACLLCYNDRDRDADCICANPEALVRHIGRMHTGRDYEREVDISWS